MADKKSKYLSDLSRFLQEKHALSEPDVTKALLFVFRFVCMSAANSFIVTITGFGKFMLIQYQEKAGIQSIDSRESSAITIQRKWQFKCRFSRLFRS
jgi:nucleoid DNA-binding protein